MFHTTSRATQNMLIGVQSPVRLCAWDSEAQRWICYYPITDKDGEVYDCYIEEFKYYITATLWLQEDEDIEKCRYIETWMDHYKYTENSLVLDYYKKLDGEASIIKKVNQ